MNDERARQALEHLQLAALEMIAAARAVLDVAEDLVRDPTVVVTLAAAMAEAAPASGEPGRRTASRVEHIRVS